jgi:hypothetical protein
VVYSLYDDYTNAEELFEIPAEKKVDNSQEFSKLRRLHASNPISPLSHSSMNRSISMSSSKPRKTFYLTRSELRNARMPKILGKDSLLDKSSDQSISLIKGKDMDEAKSYGFKDHVIRFASEKNQKNFVDSFNCFMSKVKREPTAKKQLNLSTQSVQKTEQFSDIMHKLTHKFEKEHNLMKDCDSYLNSFQGFIGNKPFKSKYYIPQIKPVTRATKHTTTDKRPSTSYSLKTNDVRGFICSSFFLEEECLLAIHYVSHVICVFKLVVSERGKLNYNKVCTIPTSEIGTSLNICKNTVHFRPCMTHATTEGNLYFYEIEENGYKYTGHHSLGCDVILIVYVCNSVITSASYWCALSKATCSCSILQTPR